MSTSLLPLSCCITGHRDIPPEKQAYVKHALQSELSLALAEGYHHFLSGFAPGADLLFARLVLEAQKMDPILTLEAALPYPGWIKRQGGQRPSLLEKCQTVGVHSPRYTPGCFFVRNQYMVDSCQRVIAVYDGREKGGTFFTLRYAKALGRDLRIISI